jgi:hypothetical protein
MNFIGMDIHKKATVAVVKDEQGNLLKEAKFENSKENFQEFLNTKKFTYIPSDIALLPI